MIEDNELLVEGSSAFFHTVFGDSNWERWQQIKQQTNHLKLREYIAWLLDLAEDEINRSVVDLHESQPQVIDIIKLDDEHINQSSDNDDTRQHDNCHNVVKGKNVSDKQDHIFTQGNTAGYGVFVNAEYELDAGDSNELLNVDSAVKIEQQVEQVETSNNGQPVGDRNYALGDVAPESEAEFEVISNPDNKSFTCSLCSVSLADMEIVKEHVNIRHSNSAFSVACLCCQYRFSTMEEYVNFHTKKALQSGATKSGFVCHICAKSFTAKTNLEGHILNKHQKSAPTFICPFCRKGFCYKSSLSAHKKRCNAPVKL